jgi:hypothetical protein
MAVTVCLPLFGHPGNELEESVAVQGRHLRKLADDLHVRLNKAADTVDKLRSAGWTTQMALFDVVFHREGVESEDEAVRQIQALGLDPEAFMIVEDVEEDASGQA